MASQPGNLVIWETGTGTHAPAVVHVVVYSVRTECRHGSVVGRVAYVVARYPRNEPLVVQEMQRMVGWRLVPVPQESILMSNCLYGSLSARDRKTPSAIVLRQILPRQTKSTDTDSGILNEGISNHRNGRGRGEAKTFNSHCRYLPLDTYSTWAEDEWRGGSGARGMAIR